MARKVSSVPDVTRLAKAMSMPGIDPRPWIETAYVTAFHIDEEGPFVDIIMVVDGIPTPETARVGSIYAGPGFGFYFPLDVDDEILVFAPGGNANAGLIALPRQWSKSDPPPESAMNEPTNILLHAKEGANINLVVSGDAKINLGDTDLESLTDGIVTGQGVDSFSGSTYGALGNASDVVRAKK